ncbi:MAG: hypothetical protein P4M02_07300 [Clostridia bacterium]|nr:hypothetical protein [Clostridia bacterium]
MVDLHTHILPCFDDGSKSCEETVQLIKMEVDDGVKTIALTPHFMYTRYPISEFVQKRSQSCEAVKKALSLSNMRINIITGAEVLLCPEMLNAGDLKELCYSNTDFMLVELPVDYYRGWIPEVLYQLKLRGITPVVAHVERYPYFVQHAEILYDLVLSGSIAQINADSAIAADHKKRSFISNLIEHNLVHIVSSDAHSLSHRPPRLREAMQIIEKKYGSDVADYYKTNSDRIADNQEPEWWEPVKIRKKLF